MVLNTRIEPNSIRTQISWHMNSGQHQGNHFRKNIWAWACSHILFTNARKWSAHHVSEMGGRGRKASTSCSWQGWMNRTHIGYFWHLFFSCQINYLPLWRFSSVIAATWARFSHLHYLRYVYFIPHYFYFAEAASGGRRSLSTGRWFIRWNGCLWFYH